LDVIEGAEFGKVTFVLKGHFDGGDFLGIAMGEIGDVALTDTGAVAKGLAEIDGRIGFSVGGGPESARDIHVHIVSEINEQIKINC